MSHTYEAFVDIRECDDKTGTACHVFTKRYEIDAVSRSEVGETALYRATGDYPKATEYDIRITRCLH